MTKVMRSKGGTKEHIVDLNDPMHRIPDLWPIVVELREEGYNEKAELVADCWHLAHDLKRHILEQVRVNTVVLLQDYLGKPPATAEGELVLRRLPIKISTEGGPVDTTGVEYVTHFHNLEDGGYHNGHYFPAHQYVKAVQDYAARLAEYLPELNQE